MWGGISSRPHPAAEETNGWINPADVPDSESFLALFEDRALGFHFHLGHSDWASAETYLNELTATFCETDSILIHTLLDALQSTLLYYQGKLDEAYAGFSKVHDSLADMQATGLLWQVYRFLSWCEARTGHEELALRMRVKADDLLTRLTPTLSPTERAIYQLNKWTAEEEFLAGEFDRLSAIRQQAACAWIFRRVELKWKFARQILSMLGHIDRYQSEIGERVAGARPAPLRNRFAVVRWICAQGRRQATIRFVVLPDRVIVIHVRTISIDFNIAPLSRIQLRDAVRGWHEAVAK